MSRESKGPHPNGDFSLPQLLYATKKKLQEITAGGRNATTLNEAEVDLLEQDISEILSLFRSIKNGFSPINRIPPEVFSLLPNYWERQNYRDCQDADRDLISLTHVCRGWRAFFTSRPSLWTWLDCKNADKTRVYIERSRSFPLEISLMESSFMESKREVSGSVTMMYSKLRLISYDADALLAATAHINRLDSLVIYKSSPGLQDLLDCSPFPAPLLKELKIVFGGVFDSDATLPSATFLEDLSPLRKLSLSGVVTHLPWRNLSNLTEFEFFRPSMLLDSLSVVQLLDFLENAPLLRNIVLCDAPSAYFRVPPDQVVSLPNRVVPLPNLERLTVDELPVDSTFFDHLSIPTGASLDLRFNFHTRDPQIPVCLDNTFGNLCHITTIDLILNTPCWARARLSSPSGELCISGNQIGKNCSIFPSVCNLDLSKTQTLSITGLGARYHDKVEESSIFQLLPLMDDLRTLRLIRVDHRPFIHALNPKNDDSRTVLYPQLEKLVVYSKTWDRDHIKELVEMASQRAKRRSKLSSIIIASSDGCYPREEASSLKKYVSHVEYRAEDLPPGWNVLFGGVGGGSGYDRDWDTFSGEDGRRRRGFPRR